MIKALLRSLRKKILAPVTNGDWIRSANDEELAGMLYKFSGWNGCFNCPAITHCIDGKCREAWLYWLGQPVEEGS